MLSPRLKLIYDQALSTGPFWDLCCDHGLLGEYAIQTKSHDQVYFLDQVPGIIEKLKARLAHMNLPKENYYSWDASKINWPVKGTVVIAGVGDRTMIKIIENLMPYLRDPFRLVLAPQKKPAKIKAFLAAQNLKLVSEKVIQERGHFREVFSVGREGHDIVPWGNLLWADRNQVVKDYQKHLRMLYTELSALEKTHHNDLTQLKQAWLAASGPKSLAEKKK